MFCYPMFFTHIVVISVYIFRLCTFSVHSTFLIVSYYAFFKDWLLPSPSPIIPLFYTSFTTKIYFETLIYNLGCFPLDNEP